MLTHPDESCRTTRSRIAGMMRIEAARLAASIAKSQRELRHVEDWLERYEQDAVLPPRRVASKPKRYRFTVGKLPRIVG